jgi:hypothetical protein
MTDSLYGLEEIEILDFNNQEKKIIPEISVRISIFLKGIETILIGMYR